MNMKTFMDEFKTSMLEKLERILNGEDPTTVLGYSYDENCNKIPRTSSDVIRIAAATFTEDSEIYKRISEFYKWNKSLGN